MHNRFQHTNPFPLPSLPPSSFPPSMQHPTPDCVAAPSRCTTPMPRPSASRAEPRCNGGATVWQAAVMHRRGLCW